uniref:Reverse transcriptase n=1 Tax=Tanacetum cinerariifolium TaxID=118510 RepID=A0A6L2JYB7_TANCI|nr:reverse transcriptase [Tanacetum cinerariifolium]
MAGELSEMMRKINVNEAEEEIVVFDGDNGNNDSQSCLKRTILGREHTDRPYKFQRMKKALSAAWRPRLQNAMVRVHIQYDRLPNFCYWCGLLGHTEKERLTKPIEINWKTFKDWPFHENLRASNSREDVSFRVASPLSHLTSSNNQRTSKIAIEGTGKGLSMQEMIVHNGRVERKNSVSGVTTNSNPTSTLNIMGQKELKTSNGAGLELDTGRNLECSLNKSIKAEADVENTILSKSWKRRTQEEIHTKSTSGTRSISIVGKISMEELDNGDQMDVDIVKNPKEVGEHNLTTTSVAAQHRLGQ